MILVTFILTAIYGLNYLANKSPNSYKKLTIGGIEK